MFAKVSSRNKGEIMTLAVVGKLRAFDTSRWTIKEWIKEVF